VRTAALVVTLASLVIPGAWTGAEPAPAIVRPQARGPISGLTRVEAAFTPGDDIAGLIRGHVARAKRTIQMHAYLFTDRALANALLAALRRGVEVEIVADAAQHEAGGLPFLAALDRAGARIYLNDAYAASHNKVVIIDAAGPGATVITGSYNFTQAAQSKNAENVVVLSGNRELTGRFADNFQQHRARSRTWPSKPLP
jgi:phosphatidylserine/phosphatidylglycerophosphate/cardiolipin synthase-like enzyme